MTIQLTEAGMKAIFPRAPKAVIDSFVRNQDVLDKAGVTHTRTRLSYFFANLEHETAGWTVKNLTESTAYSAARACQVWPSRFKSAADCYAKVGSHAGDPAFPRKLLNSVYGGRMGNRPGTDDGFNFIGRGGPQWTGRDGYAELQRRTGIPVVTNPGRAADPSRQAEISVAFWDWKKLNALADAGDFRGVVKRWNGGYIGMADREHLKQGNDPIIARLAVADRVKAVSQDLPGDPPTKEPPKEVLADASKRERATTNSGVAITGAGGSGEAANVAMTEQPDKPLIPSFLTWTCIGVGVAVIIVGTILVARKKAAVIKNWM